MENQAPIKPPRLDLSEINTRRKGLGKQLRSSLKMLSSSGQASPQEGHTPKAVSASPLPSGINRAYCVDAVDANLSLPQQSALPSIAPALSPVAARAGVARSPAPRVPVVQEGASPKQAASNKKPKQTAPVRTSPSDNPVRSFLRFLLAAVPTPVLVGAAFTSAALATSLAFPGKAPPKKPACKGLFGIKLTWYSWDSLKQWGLLAPLKQ